MSIGKEDRCNASFISIILYGKRKSFIYIILVDAKVGVRVLYAKRFTCHYHLYFEAKKAVKHENCLSVLISNTSIQPCRCAKI